MSWFVLWLWAGVVSNKTEGAEVLMGSEHALTDEVCLQTLQTTGNGPSSWRTRRFKTCARTQPSRSLMRHPAEAVILYFIMWYFFLLQILRTTPKENHLLEYKTPPTGNCCSETLWRLLETMNRFWKKSALKTLITYDGDSGETKVFDLYWVLGFSPWISISVYTDSMRPSIEIWIEFLFGTSCNKEITTTTVVSVTTECNELHALHLGGIQQKW